MIAANALAAYRKNQVTTSSPERLVLLLYDEAIRALKRGGASLERGDIQEVNDNLCHAQEIIAYLLAALDREEGGGLAANLASLYNYVLRLATRANVEKDPRSLAEAVALMSELRSGWQGALIPEHARAGAAG